MPRERLEGVASEKRASGPIEDVPRWVAEVFRVELAWEEEAGEQ